ncbi:DUF664 domain-containing protein [Cellulomonas sp. NTE-D12]|uniref:mycothiol transferase n=1 Tax=Cellulomonas sp. NTE-D12 TaxID=2962632 RepID=UPI003081CF80|nr:hypothetical protein CELD12_11830 [Cellulomonas sp. NTE-D12]
MDVSTLLTELFSRIPEVLHRAAGGLDAEGLAFRPDADANSIAWLVWHAARVQDAQLADVAGLEQVWTSEGWVQTFGLPLDAGDTGYGHTSAQVAQVVVPAEDLLGYVDAVAAFAAEYVGGLNHTELDRVVDRRWQPPVTLGVRLVSIVVDATEHAGQAAYLRGLVDRSRG